MEKDFFTQNLLVENINQHSWDYCKKLSEGKKVLHVGCSDWPIFNPKGNMHIHLKPFCSEIVGLDINGLEEMQKHCPGRYIQNFLDAIANKWDTILVPNIIEHLRNPGMFVDDLFKLKFQTMFVLVPNAKVYEQSVYNNGEFIEKVHPDHYAWYSPYTLMNLFKEHLDPEKYYCKMMFFDNHNMIAIQIERI